GKKAINNLGCYGCHTIPGFETTKPIGTALNEWGKKDPERIAFEDSPAYVHDNFQIVDVRRDLTPEEQKANERRPEEQKIKGWEVKDGKRPYERFFAEQLDHRHHTREGFLHLKLQEPRSYDYNRVRTWDDRLRMPQFKFARPIRQPEESEEAFALRASKEEAEAREAVMTFILGLVAEPVPAKYVYNPPQDRHDDADKFGPDEKNLMLRLTHALRFVNATGETHDIPAGTDILMPRVGVGGMAEPYGGAFSINLSGYLQKRDVDTYGGGKANYSYIAGPPTLIREGEKVQPGWRFQFLRNPISIRPMTVLRMPKFNMSDEDAMAIVNYFTAVDQITNPGIGS